MATKNDTATTTTWDKVRVERGIYRRTNRETGEVRYFATLRTRRGTASGTFTTVSKARAFLAKSATDIREQRFFGDVPGAKIGVREAVKSYLEAKGITQKGNVTRYARAMFWSESFGDLPLLELTANRVADVAAGLGVSSATVNRYLSVGSAMWKHWSRVRVGEKALVPLHLNPFASVERGTDSPERVVTLSKEQRAALLDACAEDVELYAAVRLALTSGCRHGELAGLRWKDLDLKEGTARLTKTKNGERRPIACDAVTLEALKSLPRGIANAHVFSERIRDRSKLRKPWLAAKKKAGLEFVTIGDKPEPFRWHDLRHVSVQVAVESGSSLVEAGLHTGHKSLAALKRYTALDPSHQKKIAERVGGAL